MSENVATSTDKHIKQREHIEHLLSDTFYTEAKLVPPGTPQEDLPETDSSSSTEPIGSTSPVSYSPPISTSSTPDVSTTGMNAILDALEADAQSCDCSVVKKVYYDINRREYLIKNADNIWMRQTEAQCRRILKSFGISGRRPEGCELSPLDLETLRINNEESVVFAGSIAGMREGFYDVGQKILVTDSPKLITPKKGDWDTLRSTILAILKDDKYPQEVYFFSWLKVALEGLYNGQHRFGQALVLAGKAGCGKSLIQNIITELFGGRSAKPYQFMTGETTFNADLFGAEHLMIEDEAPDTSFKARKKFGTALKQFTVNRTQRLHAKGRDAVSLKPFWRVSISLNDEPDDLNVLPILDESLEDKLILLQVYKRQFPVSTNTSEQWESFWKTLCDELPAFVYWLLNEFQIPDELKSERFGVKHFHHPRLLSAIGALSPEVQMLDLIDSYLLDCLPGEFTALSLEKLLRERVDRYLIDKLFSFGRACSTYLGKLAHLYPERVINRRTASARKWSITRPDVQCDGYAEDTYDENSQSNCIGKDNGSYDVEDPRLPF